MPDHPGDPHLHHELQALQETDASASRASDEPVNRLHCMEALYQLALTLAKGRSLQDNLQRLTECSHELTGADASGIAVGEEDHEAFPMRCSLGIRPDVFMSLRFNLLESPNSPTREEEKSTSSMDFTSTGAIREADRPIIAREGFLSDMIVPIRMDEDVMGMLCVFRRSRTAFSPYHRDILCKIGHLAAVEIRRRKTEALLRESEERFRFMAETTGDVIYRLKYLTMSYDYISPGIRQLTGYSPEEIKESGFAGLVERIELLGKGPVSPRDIVRDRTQGKIIEYRADYLIRTRPGHPKWVRDHSFPWLDDGGHIIGSVGILSDISDYKRAEARVQERTNELIESEEKYRTLVENVPLVVYRMRPGKEILFVNHFVEEIFGFTPPEILARPHLWAERLYSEDLPKVLDLWEKSYRDGKEFVEEYRIVHKDGHLVYVMDHAIPFAGPTGAAEWLDGIIMDVTGRVRLREQLVRSEGLKTISEVSARLAHEFRNPLVSAGGFARRLLSTMHQDDPNRSKVEIIVKEVGRLEGILRMVLNYIQPVEIQKSPTDPNRWIREAIEGLETQLDERNVRMELRLTEEIDTLSIDRPKMECVLQTLIKNALTQMPAEGSLSLHTERKNGNFSLQLRYPVQHVSKDDIEHFFYPFTTFKDGYNAGDLPFSKILIDKHGGEISVTVDAAGQLLISISLPL